MCAVLHRINEKIDSTSLICLVKFLSIKINVVPRTRQTLDDDEMICRFLAVDNKQSFSRVYFSCSSFRVVFLYFFELSWKFWGKEHQDLMIIIIQVKLV